MTQEVARAAEVLVVVGGGPGRHGRPAPSTIRRAARAAALGRERPDAVVIASGGATAPGPTEAEQLASLLRSGGVAPRRVLLEDESVDTLGNAVLVAARYLAAVPPKPLTVVTSPFHARRAGWAFARALPGWTVAVAESDTGPDDEPRALDEERYLAEAEALFAGLRDGDLAGFAARLRRRWPAYAASIALRGL